MDRIPEILGEIERLQAGLWAPLATRITMPIRRLGGADRHRTLRESDPGEGEGISLPRWTPACGPSADFFLNAAML